MDFAAGGSIPAKHIPALLWDEPPSGTASFEVLLDDPDAQNYTHWVIYDLPSASRGLPEDVPAQGDLADGSRQGTNDHSSLGYFGPCPPSGVHRYSFRVYALSAKLDLAAGARKTEVSAAMNGKVLGQGEVVGLF